MQLPKILCYNYSYDMILYNKIFKIKHKLQIASGTASAPKEKLWVRTWVEQTQLLRPSSYILV